MAEVIQMMGGRDFAAVGDSTAEYDIAQSPLVGGQQEQQSQGQPSMGSGDQYAEYSSYPPPSQAPQAAGDPYSGQPPHFDAAPPTHGFQTVNDDSNHQDSTGDQSQGIDGKPRSSRSSEIVIDQERLERPMKLFVGQVPKNMTEEDLAFIFEPHGRILDLTIIRDRRSGSHRGCAFVTYESGEDAMKVVNEMHGKYTFEGATWPAQVRPAQGEIDDDSRNDGKCFLLLS